MCSLPATLHSAWSGVPRVEKLHSPLDAQKSCWSSRTARQHCGAAGERCLQLKCCVNLAHKAKPSQWQG